MEKRLKNRSVDDNRSILLLKEMIKEKKLTIDEMKRNLENYSNLIDEINHYLESVKTKRETDSYEVFSPRHSYSTDQIFIDQKLNELEEIKTKKNNLEQSLFQVDDERKKLQLILKGIPVSSKNKDDYISNALVLQDVERQRIARDLHDHTIQDLTMLIHKVDLTTKHIDHDVNCAKLEIYQLIPTIKKIIDDMRDIVFNLRPMQIDDLGLKGALTQLLDSIEMNSQMKVTYKIDDVSFSDQSVALSLFQVIQEFCANAVKHSKGSMLDILIRSEKNILTVQIEDNGIGYHENEIGNKDRHFGLQIAKERLQLVKGTLDINSSLNKGTKIKITIPIK